MGAAERWYPGISLGHLLCRPVDWLGRGEDLLLATRDGGVNWSLQHIQTSLDGGLSFSPRVTGNTGSRRRSSAAASAPFSMASILPARRPAGRSAQAGQNGTATNVYMSPSVKKRKRRPTRGPRRSMYHFKISGIVSHRYTRYRLRRVAAQGRGPTWETLLLLPTRMLVACSLEALFAPYRKEQPDPLSCHR